MPPIHQMRARLTESAEIAKSARLAIRADNRGIR